MNDCSRLWGIILAGGEGKRLRPFIRKCYGDSRPKQFCAIVGTRSMVRHTLDRIQQALPPEKILTVVNRNHRPYFEPELSQQPPETVIVQPRCLETGPGILLPLLHIYRRDPRAFAAVFPSDHFIVEEERFIDYLRFAYSFVKEYPWFLVVMGVPPSMPEKEYGWIEQGGKVSWGGDGALHHVRGFWEKPDTLTTRTLFARGCLWNTLILVGGVDLLISQFRRCSPELFNPMYDLRSLLGSPEGDEALREAYETIPPLNFSRDILEKSVGDLCVLRVSNVYWSDWGEEYRILEDVGKFNLRLRRELALSR